jgi:uncharacterized protein YjbI with pentapeptide repeats
MKASQVTASYQAGNRDFRNLNLRGANFREQDLSGADFSGADIRSANFTHAILKSTHFNDAEAGLQRRWVLGKALIALALSIVVNFIAVMFSAELSLFLLRVEVAPSRYLVSTLTLLIQFICFLAIARQGLTSKAFNVLFVTVSVAIASIGSLVSVAFAIAFAVIGAVLGAVVAAMASGFGPCAATVLGTIVGAIAGLFICGGIRVGFELNAAIEAFVASLSACAGVFAGLLLSLFVAWQIRRNGNKYATTRQFSLVLGAIGGTSFRGADLTEADFTGALLKNTRFTAFRQQPTILTRACFRNARQLDRAEPGNLAEVQNIEPRSRLEDL